jgi:ribosomal protein L37AE/L43A
MLYPVYECPYCGYTLIITTVDTEIYYCTNCTNDNVQMFYKGLHDVYTPDTMEMSKR